jgi:capsular polysaccharide biosynthesis protein
VQNQIAQYQTNLSVSPSRQEQYSELQRQYEAAKKDYETVRDQVTDAEHSTDVYQRLKLVRFRIQDYASLPSSAELPVRWKINLGGLGFALALGLVLAGIMELTDTSTKTRRDVEFYFGLKCLALVPDFPTAVESAQVARRNRTWIIAAALTALTLAALNLYIYLVIVRH